MQRRNVDLPQPDGPISAVIAFLWMSSVTPLSASAGPYDTARSLTENTVSFGISRCGWATAPNGARGVADAASEGGSATLIARSLARAVRRLGARRVNIV